MDMLPLHRFKTCRLSPDQYLSSTRLRYNPRENSTSPKRPRRLGRVIQDDTLHFMRLFNPLAERQVRLLRGAYPHLRQIQWPKVCSDTKLRISSTLHSSRSTITLRASATARHRVQGRLAFSLGLEEHRAMGTWLEVKDYHGVLWPRRLPTVQSCLGMHHVLY